MGFFGEIKNLDLLMWEAASGGRRHDNKHKGTKLTENHNAHSKALRDHRREQGCFFVTKALSPRRKIIAAEFGKLICSTWMHYAEQKKILLGAFVIMPDHFHLLFAPLGLKSVSQRLREALQWVHKNSGDFLKLHGCGWQDGFHETRIRSSKQFHFVRNYIISNPVKAGLCGAPEKWEWSSANPLFNGLMALPWPWRFEQDD